MNNMKTITLWFCTVFSVTAGGVYGQELAVRNVRFTDLGATVEIVYTLAGDPERKCEVSVALSHDGGTTYGEPLRYVSGDVGRNIRPGSEKTIVWELEAEYPFGLLGDHFVFAVTVRSQKVRMISLPAVLAGAGVVGAVIALLVSREAAESSMSITIPAEYE